MQKKWKTDLRELKDLKILTISGEFWLGTNILHAQQLFNLVLNKGNNILVQITGANERSESLKLSLIQRNLQFSKFLSLFLHSCKNNCLYVFYNYNTFQN